MLSRPAFSLVAASLGVLFMLSASAAHGETATSGEPEARELSRALAAIDPRERELKLRLLDLQRRMVMPGLTETARLGLMLEMGRVRRDLAGDSPACLAASCWAHEAFDGKNCLARGLDDCPREFHVEPAS